MKTAKQLLCQRWTVIGPRQVELDGEYHWEIRVSELPDFFVAGETREEVLGAYMDALEAFLESYVEAGEEPPPPPDDAGWRFKLQKPVSRDPEDNGSMLTMLAQTTVTSAPMSVLA